MRPNFVSLICCGGVLACAACAEPDSPPAPDASIAVDAGAADGSAANDASTSDAATDAAVAVVCPTKLVASHAGRAYQFCPEPASHADATANCASFGGHLVKIEAQVENDFVYATANAQALPVGNEGPRLIGLNRIGVVDWRWHDGSQLGAYFPQNEPASGDWSETDRECIVIVVNASPTATNGAWHPKGCDGPHPYVCEMD